MSPYDKLSSVEGMQWMEGAKKLLLSLQNVAKDLRNRLFLEWTMNDGYIRGKHISINVLSVEFSEQPS